MFFVLKCYRDTEAWIIEHAYLCAHIFIHVWLFVILWTAACQTSLSMRFPRQEYWSGLPSPPEDLPKPWMELASPALQADSLLLSHQENPIIKHVVVHSPNHIQLFGTSMNHSMSGISVLHYLLEFAQTLVYCIGDTIQPSHPVTPFSFCPQSFPASGYFPMNQLFTLGGQSIGASASALVLPMNIQGWFPLG